MFYAIPTIVVFAYCPPCPLMFITFSRRTIGKSVYLWMFQLKRLSPRPTRLTPPRMFVYDGHMSKNEVLSVRAVAAWTGKHPEAVRRLIRSGALPATPRGNGPKSGYVVRKADVLRLREQNQHEAVFIESAPLFPDLPSLNLPPVRGTACELIEYAETCQRMAETALSMARQRMAQTQRGEDER
jgi:hypothetical protein